MPPAQQPVPLRLVPAPASAARHAEPRPAPRRPSRLPYHLQSARSVARALVSELQTVLATTPADQHSRWTHELERAQELVRAIEGGAASDPKPLGPSLEQRRQFGRLLRDRRNAAGLSRLELGRLAKLSDATIKFLETFSHAPSRATLIRLLDVQALGLVWEDVAPLLPGQPRPVQDEVRADPIATPTAVQSPIPPGCDPMRLSLEFARLLNGPGGHIEPHYAYVDPASAVEYLAALQQTPASAGLRESVPLAEMAQRIRALAGSRHLHLLALGAGDGALEVRLAQHLLEPSNAGLELALLDVSQPLLFAAYQRAIETLGANPRARLVPVHANLNHLPLGMPVGAAVDPASALRLFLLLGNTLGDLDDEPRFLRHKLPGCAPGDLLLLDIPLAGAPPEQPDEIKRLDPLWLRGLSASQQAWLSGPLWRHARDTLEVRLAWRLETHCALPGSYALEVMATVKARIREDRAFSLYRFKRYDPEKLSACLTAWGWRCVAQLPYGADRRPSAALLLFQRERESA